MFCGLCSQASIMQMSVRFHDDYVSEQLKPIVNHYRALAGMGLHEYEQQVAGLNLPLVSQSLLQELCGEVSEVFLSEPGVLDINAADLVVVGNLHGHLMDLLRIMNRFGPPPETKYLFLGDLVDEGEFSTEVITLVFALKFLHRDSVFLIRGNHEFSVQSHRGGLTMELVSMYGNNTIANAFMHAFACLPLAAVVNGRVFCAHSGILPSSETLEDVKRIRRPMHDIDNPILRALLLSVPARPGIGARASGHVFGQKALLDFLDRNRLDLMIRSHDFVECGLEEHFDGRLVTLFSASTFQGADVNKACAIMINENGDREVFFYPACHIMRKSAGVRITNQRSARNMTPPPSGGRGLTQSRSQLPALGLVEAPQRRKMKTEREMCRSSMMRRRSPAQRHTLDGRLRKAVNKEMGRVEELTGIRLSNTYSSLMPLTLGRK